MAEGTWSPHHVLKQSCSVVKMRHVVSELVYEPRFQRHSPFTVHPMDSPSIVFHTSDLLAFVGLPQEGPTLLDGDSASAIAWTEDLIGHGKRKHIDLAHYHVNDAVKDSTVKFIKVPSKDNRADCLTKVLKSSTDCLRQYQKISTFGKFDDRYS